MAAFLATAAPAWAAEAFLCGPDTVVYVEANELEHKKRTDPCIAGYYGLTIAPEQAAPTAPVIAPVIKATAPRAVAASSPPPAERVAALAPTITPAPVAKAAPVTKTPVARTPVTSAPAPAAANITVASVAPVANFRNVRILNAKSPKAAWFRHDK
ncbi:MAG: hypothetical protein ACKVP4_08745 [Hyphomicrobium sp.]